MTGFAFALFYSAMGIPIARWADRGDRVKIISVTIALWSAAVALCGAATSFLQLLLIRVGVAVGEAGCIPPAHSLIPDYFTRAERPRAVAIYMLGGPLSVVIGYLLAGWLNEFYGWRMTFLVLGLPGLGISALTWRTLREPRREKSVEVALRNFSAVADRNSGTGATTLAHPGLREVWRTLWTNITFRHLLFCFSVVYFFGYGILQWQPTFFIRTYAMDTGAVGTWFAIIYGVGGVLGTYLGGELATRYAAGNERLQLQAIAIAYAGFGIVSACIYLAPNHYLALGLTSLSAVGGATASGPLFAVIQSLVPQRMRAVSVAIIYLCANLIGMGLGPLAAGVLSDALRPLAGKESLRYALLALCPGYLWGAWHLLRGSATVAGDLARLQTQSNSAGETPVVNGTPA
jgi:MFS family permease